jgi:hypothetical protein
VQAYPKADRRLQVSSAGGMHPTWNPKGGEIFYRLADDMFSVRMTVTPAGPALAPPVKLFSARYGFGGGLTIPNYAVMPDGERFVMVKEQSRAILNVVLNWFEEPERSMIARERLHRPQVFAYEEDAGRAFADSHRHSSIRVRRTSPTAKTPGITVSNR